MVRNFTDKVRLEVSTSSTISAVFFPTLLSMAKMPSPFIIQARGAPTTKYVHKPIELRYYVDLGTDEWPWPTELSAYELEKILSSFNDKELAMFVAGEIDGDGAIRYEKIQNNKEKVTVLITACKACPKRLILDVLRDTIAKRFGIIGTINHLGTDDALVFRGEKAVRLLRLIRPFVHHPLRRLRIELILALHDGKISREAFEELYKTTEYERGAPDIKRNHALEALAQTAPQTHTHGRIKHKPKN